MANEWTVGTLKKYFDASVRSLKEYFDVTRADDQRALAAALVNTQLALEKVASAMESKFASMNEFRGALSDQSKEMMTRNEAQAELGSIRQEIATEFRRINDKIEGLTKTKDEGTGKSSGFDKSWAILLGAAALVGALVALWRH